MAHVSYQAPYENFIGRDSERFTPNGAVNFRRAGIPIARRFVRPRQPESPQQFSARFLFSLSQTTFSNLTDTQKDSWTALGLTITRTNPAGFTYNPSGRSLFTEQFLITTRNGEGYLTSAPATVIFNPILPPNDCQVGGGPPETIVFFPALAANTRLLLYFTKPLSPAIRSLRGRAWLNYAKTPFDPDFTSGSFFSAIALDSAVHLPDSTADHIPTIGTNIGIRLTVLDDAVAIAGPSYDTILIPHGP